MKVVRDKFERAFFLFTCIIIAAGIMGLYFVNSARAAASTVSVSNWQQVKSAVLNGESSVEIILTKDMTLIGGNVHNIGKDIVIDLAGHTIDANNQQVFWNEKGRMTIKNGTIKNARSDTGGAINNRGTMVLENVNIINCTAKQGGGILNYGMLTMTGGSIKNCRAGRAGAIRILPHDSDKSAIAQYATAILTNVEISGNISDGITASYGRGGAIGVSRGTLTLKGCKLTGNRSVDDGGAIDFDAKDGYLTITDTEIRGNSVFQSNRQGGGINLERGSAEIRNCTIINNTAPDGGGIYIAESFDTASIYGTTISYNKSIAYGGAGVCNHSSLHITENSVIEKNYSMAGGAGIWSNRNLQVADSTVSGNWCLSSDADGGGISVSGGTAVLQSVKIDGNRASDGGGINIVSGAALTVSGTSYVTGNTVSNSGGGIMNKGTLNLLDKVTITDNTCGANGGAIYFNGSALKMQGKFEIKDNSDNNLFLFDRKTITITGKIDDDSVIYVTTGSGERTFTSGFSKNGNKNVDLFVHDGRQDIVNDNGEAGVIFNVLSGDIFDRVTVIIHPAGQNSALNIRDNGRGPGQNVVQLFNTGDSCRFFLTRADENSYYIDYFDGADDYSPSTKRFDLSDKNGYGNSGNVVHVVKGNSTATNKRWMFVRNSDGTYYIQNKRSGLFWDLENNNYNNKNKLCQRSLQSAQAWEIEVVAADGSYSIDYVKKFDSFSFESSGEIVRSCSWMSELPDELYITDLSIPGTHDAGAAHTSTCNSSAQCQQLSIHDQLNAGIRYFDLRIGPDQRIVHGATNCQFNGDGLYLDRVMNWIREFLRDNPGEVVILQPMENRGGDKVDKAAYNYFKKLVEKERNLFYIGDHVPTLGECRGKILILSRLNYGNKDYQTEGGQWALEARNWQTSRTDREYYDNLDLSFDFRYRHYTDTNKKASGLVATGNNYEIWSQDDYEKTGDDKWEVIYNSIFDDQTGAQAKYNWWNRAKENKNLWLVAYTSCNDFWAAKYPQDTARNINPRVKKQIMGETDMSNGKFLGVVCTDFADEQMAYLIYRQNFAMTHVIIHGVTADGKEPFLPLVYNVAMNQPLNETLGLKESEIDTYFTRNNYATHDYSYKASTNLLCRVPMSELKNEAEYEAAAVDLGTLRGSRVYELYVGLDRRMNTTQNLLFEVPDCLTDVTGINGDDWSGQTPIPQFKEAENAHYHIAKEGDRPKAYWIVSKNRSIFDNSKPEPFTGKLESGKSYSAMVELEADWGYCFSTDWLCATAHIIGSDGKTEDTDMDTGEGMKIFPYTVTVTYNRAAVSHDLILEEAKEATLEEEGLLENYYCRICGKHFADENCTTELKENEVTIPALGKVPQEQDEHRWSEPEYAWAEDYSTVTAKRVCACIPDDPHTEIETVSVREDIKTPVTCEQDGRSILTAVFTNEAFEVQTREITRPALKHQWDEGIVTKEASCTEDGVMTFTCQNDGTHKKTEVIKAAGHVPGRHVLSGTDTATCTDGGIQTVETVCLICGKVLKTEQETTQPLGHKWSEPQYTMSASDGEKFMTAEHTCQDCGATEKETVGVTTEDYCYYSAAFENVFFEMQEWALGEGSGEEEQYEVRWRKGSGEEAVFEIKRFYEGGAQDESVEFESLQIDGITVPESEYTYTCMLDLEMKSEYHTVTIKADMLESLSVGTHSIVALYRYGDEEKYVSEIFEVLDENEELPDQSEHLHSPTEVQAKNATCTEDGNIGYWVCDGGEDRCGKYFLDRECTIEITPEDTVIKAAGHAWKEWTVTKEPTDTEDGEETRICRCDASHKESRSIPRTAGRNTSDVSDDHAEQVGDNSNVLFLVLLFAAASQCVIMTVLMSVRKNKHIYNNK